MNTSTKILIGGFAILILVLGIWIASLRSKLNDVDDSKEKYWKEQYESAQDSIDIIRIERDKLATERDYLDSTRIYWKGQYKYADSLLKNVKPKYNENIVNIRNADATERNRLLSDRIRQINSRR